MMTRRITLSLAAATLTLILIGILVFAATGRDQPAASTSSTDVGTSNIGRDPIAAIGEN